MSYKQHINEDGYTSELNYIYYDGEDIWVSSTNNFYSYTLISGEKKSYNEKLAKFNINSSRITYISPDKNDEDIIWLGGIDIGLVKYHKINGVIKQYKHDISNKNSLFNNYINCMKFDDLGNLWIGTNIGLSKFDVTSEKFTSYTTAEGLSNNFINSIEIDNSGYLWISTSYGLNKLDSELEKFINFTSVDGVLDSQFNLNSSIKFDNGFMLFGSTSGLTYFDSNNIINPKSYDEKVVIGDIYIGKNKVTYNGKELVLKYNDKDLYIDYFLPDYQSLNMVTYEYMIEGFDSDWRYIDDRNYLEIKTLDSGKYTLKIRARDGYGNLTEETTMNIKVNRPIWSTPLAYIVYIIIILVIIYYILNYVKILQRLVEQKTISLNKQLK